MKNIIDISTDYEDNDDTVACSDDNKNENKKEDFSIVEAGRKRKASGDFIDISSEGDEEICCDMGTSIIDISHDTDSESDRDVTCSTLGEKSTDTHKEKHGLGDIRKSDLLIDSPAIRKNIFDSHCHIDFILNRKYKNKNVGTYCQLVRKFPGLHHPKLEGFITNFCDPFTWPSSTPPYILASAWLNRGIGVYYTVGCHPHFADKILEEGAMERLEKLLVDGRNMGCVAVGECGLDRSRGNRINMQVQIKAFRLQVELAVKLNLPLVLHIREAEEEGRQVLRDCCLPKNWPVHRHCWNDSWELCKEWLDEFTGSMVGLTGLITFRQKYQAREVARLISLERLVLETDSPYFIPDNLNHLLLQSSQVPKFCHPLQLLGVAVEVANTRSMTVENVLEQCRQNVSTVYRIPLFSSGEEALNIARNILEDMLNSMDLFYQLDPVFPIPSNVEGLESPSTHNLHESDSSDMISKSIGTNQNIISPGTEELSFKMRRFGVLCEVSVPCVPLSPSTFWVQKIGPHSVELDRLTQDMTDYYNNEDNQKFHRLSTASEGDIVVCKFSGDDSFYRAKVNSFQENTYDPEHSTVELDYLDFGDDEERIISDIFEIRTEYLKLKFQAIQCCMANIRPFGGVEWSNESCDLFEALTHCALWKILFAKVVEYKTNSRGQLIPCVEMIDTSRSGTDLNIGKEMIKQGMAVPAKKEDLKKEENIEHLVAKVPT